MSATPPQQPSKGPRRSVRRQKHLQTPEDRENTLATSENDFETPSTARADERSPNKEVASKGRRKSQAKKGQDYPKSGQSTQNDHHNAPIAHPERPKATPIKPAYAASTFLNSPAPSALPIPSFYSKSVPNVSTMKPPNVANDSGEATLPKTDSDATTSETLEPRQRESTPLDFLFDAARRARGTSGAESPSLRSNHASAYGDSPSRGSPAPREGGAMFPFELDDTASKEDVVGPAFATPFKARIEAVRPSTSSDQSPSVEERERRAKTEALKKLLMNSHNLRSASDSPYGDSNNPLNARALPPRNAVSPQYQNRHHSGPSTPHPEWERHNSEPSPQYFPEMTPSAKHGQTNPPSAQRPPSSHLRHVYQPNLRRETSELSTSNSATSPLISTANKYNLRHQTPRQGLGNGSAQIHPPTPQPRPTAQQLEDDLKKFLKLDLSSKG